MATATHTPREILDLRFPLRDVLFLGTPPIFLTRPKFANTDFFEAADSTGGRPASANSSIPEPR
jgi:hypothetical protein